MSLNHTPSAERVHIGFFGKRNAGKSSLINAITNQAISIVSEQKGTTTDPVLKAMELLPLGPVVLMDTPGLDDEGDLGAQRVAKAYQMLEKADVAMLVVDGSLGMTAEDEAILAEIKARKIPFVIVMNKADLVAKEATTVAEQTIWVSSASGENINALKELLAKQMVDSKPEQPLVSDLVNAGDFVILVVPIDKAAPKGRLILPQQQTIRELLEVGAVSIVVKETELAETLKRLGQQPALVITDSQVFDKAALDTPKSVYLTSFSILFARYKGQLEHMVHGASIIDALKDGDKILISEGCTHHRQCDDIGTVKLPNMLNKYTGKQLQYEFTSGGTFPTDLSPYRLVIHCGGCMLQTREMQYRLGRAKVQAVPMTNYGISMAHMRGILARSIEIFEKNGMSKN